MSDAYTPQHSFAQLITEGVLEIGDGYRAKLNKLGGTGPIFLRAGRLTEHGINWDGAEQFDGALAPKLVQKRGQPGDTMVTTKGNSIGRAGYVACGAPEFVYSPHLSYWRSLNHNRLDPGFLRYWARGPELRTQLHAMAHGTDMAPYLSLIDQQRLRISLPPIEMQKGLAEVLSAFDDKIEANEGARRALRALGSAWFDQALERASAETAVGDLTVSLARGIAPKYTEAGVGVLVLNQKCIRDGWASIEAGRWMQDVSVPDAKKARRGDIVVNSTGVGTLGRVARWVSSQPIAVDGHVTVVRPSDAYPSAVVGYAMLAAQPQIEALGEGSTGQTELSRTRLTQLRIQIPNVTEANRIADGLEALDDQAEALLDESRRLAASRDLLLQPLLSGELRVRDAETVVEAG